MIKKLYDKNEIYFSLVWIAVYCFFTMPIRSNFGDTSPILTLWLAFMASAICIFIYRHHLKEKYGITKWRGSAAQYLFFLPLFIIMTGNLWNGIYVIHHGTKAIFAVLSMLLVGFIEEMIFRGFLFRAMLKKMKHLHAIAISALTFGLGHILNLFSGQGGVDSLIQIIFALAWGFIFTYLFYKTGCILIGVLVHGVIDASSVFAVSNIHTDLIFTAVSLLVSVLYGLYLSRKPSRLLTDS